MGTHVPLLALAAHERPRERLIALGPVALTDAELVAIQLGSGSRGVSVLALAQSLLAEFGGVAGLSGALPEELSRHCGVGPAKATRLAASFALADRVEGDPLHQTVRTSADIARVVSPMISRARTEQVVVVACDSQHRVCRIATVAHGGVDSSPFPVREILALVLRHDGVAFAVAHNHPGGTTEPSSQDRSATTELANAASAVGLRFLDHLIVAGDNWASVTPSR
jgi:DNA repair protein RadC